MRILMAFFPAADPGGIINHTEQLILGFRDLGHLVDQKLFVPEDRAPRKIAGGKGSISAMGYQFDQRHGYSWPATATVPYMGKQLPHAIRVLEQYDLVIWQTAVPTKRKENFGNSDWIDLYEEAKVRQLAVIHDGNFLKSYPWLYQISHNLAGVICVHHCAYNSASNIDVPSKLVFNPQDMSRARSASYSSRAKGYLSLQTFKAWKHVPELVAAVPHAKLKEQHLAGKGIDYYYLTSKDKCKWPGLWEEAISSGMKYHDVITNEQRDEMLLRLMCLVDPSWSKAYSKIGGHFNRVIVDALMQGAIPIVRPLGISTNVEGKGELFVAGENCLSIPQDADAKEYGMWLEAHCNMSEQKYNRVLSAGQELLHLFDRKYVASQFLSDEFSQVGMTSTQVKTDSYRAIEEFFDV